MYNVRILADSVSPDAVRLTTMEVVCPRFLLAEFNTHRMLSRNSASSRAIPTEKLIEQVLTRPFIPEFNHRVTGMGVGDPLTGAAALTAEAAWMKARLSAVEAVRGLIALDVDKSRVNRLLEPFMWHTALVTATEWGNFFALRTDSGAQPEFRKLAMMMQDAYYEANDPWHCPSDCWHLPLCDLEEMGNPIDYHYWRKVCAGRCARVSYLTHDGVRDPCKDIGLHNRLFTSRHLSPFEHVARPFTELEWAIVREEQRNLRMAYARLYPKQVEQWCRSLEYCGNLRGWRSYRSEIPNEHDFSLVRAA